MAQEQTVFLVDDDAAVRGALSAVLDASGYKSVGFDSAKNFLDYFNPMLTGCLILDVRMPEMNGLELQSKLLDMKCSLPIIFITGNGSSPEERRALDAGALAFLQKPFEFSSIVDKIEEAFSSKH